MLRIRIKEEHLGQIDELVYSQYIKSHGESNFTNLIRELIGDVILKHPVNSIEDIHLAKQYVKNLHYKDIGSFLEEYMRRECEDDLRICKNCYAKCSRCENEFQAACENFSRFPHIPGV